MAQGSKIYTKPWVVDFILDLVGYDDKHDILSKCIVEPSCGEGSFTSQIIDRLCNATEQQKGSLSWQQLSRCLRAYDLDPVALKKAQEGAAKILAEHGCPASVATNLINSWFICADFLLTDAPACDWVVGNPPYIRSVSINRQKREAYVKALPCMSAGCDLYIGFFDKGLSLLNDGGTLGFICSDHWMQNAYGRKLRAELNRDNDLFGSAFNLTRHIRMYGVDAFASEVDAYPAITTITKQRRNDSFAYVSCESDFSYADIPSLHAWLEHPSADKPAPHCSGAVLEKPSGDRVFSLGNAEDVAFVHEAVDRYPQLVEAAGIGIGIATGCDDIFLTENPNIVEPSRLLPLFYMRDYRRGQSDRQRWLINPWSKNGDLVTLSKYPRLKAYYEAHRTRLERRHIARKNEAEWYRTIDKPKFDLLSRPLLLLPDLAAHPDPILSEGKYPHHNCYWIDSDIWDLEVLGGLLMSRQTQMFIDTLGVKMRGNTLRFQAQYLKLLHIPEYDDLSPEIRNGLRLAFRERNRDKASTYTQAAYKATRNEKHHA